MGDNAGAVLYVPEEIMEKADVVVPYLKQKYHPEIIILEGSRANGSHRPDSDWDFYLLVKDASLESGRDQFDNESLDISLVKLPITDDFILKNYYGPLNTMTVLLDDSVKTGEQIVKRTKAIREQGRAKLSEVEINNRHVRLAGMVRKMEATHGEPLLHFYYRAVFYELVLRYWFELHQQWTLHPREGLPFISQNDERFYDMLNNFVVNPDLEQQNQLAKAICQNLFGEN